MRVHEPRWFHSEGLFLWQTVVVLFLPVPVHATGLILGVVALFFRDRRKLLPLLGVILNLVYAALSLIPWIWLALHAPGVK